MMFARSGADPAWPVGGASMSEPQDAASESIRQTAMPGHGWPAPVADDVRSQRSRSGFAGRRSQHERAAGRGERIIISVHGGNWLPCHADVFERVVDDMAVVVEHHGRPLVERVGGPV